MGAMLSETRNVITSHPEQMLVLELAILIVVAAFNLLGDNLRNAFDLNERRE